MGSSSSSTPPYSSGYPVTLRDGTPPLDGKKSAGAPDVIPPPPLLSPLSEDLPESVREEDATRAPLRSTRLYEVASLRTRYARVRFLESLAWGSFAFSIGAAAMSRVYGKPYWAFVLAALASWVSGVFLAKTRAVTAARLLRIRDEGLGRGESLRAKEALGGLGSALAALVSWADSAREDLELEVPVSVDPENPIPPNPIPRDLRDTGRPAKLLDAEPKTPRVLACSPPPEPPPSHPALSRDPDHDPATCPICNPVESLPPHALAFGDSYRPTEEAPSHQLPSAPVSVKVKPE